ncbi:hypothetical protein D8674_019360 [Pyrus ussuriensis x Pyrus communis]|uniref:Uncharacterized protein n=1 Tax=Pyrus ussuriensis x Pyrus communis TaxID=2448454 RepID=A0A5N5G7T2_9ROSA|nr:hypothetical protein D8674_019360 [Pyrus ussuriensis x Pyrus communis]
MKEHSRNIHHFLHSRSEELQASRFSDHHRSSSSQTPPGHIHKQEVIDTQMKEANHLCEPQKNSRTTLPETADIKKNVMVLETPKPVRAPELYTRTP